MQEYKLPSEIQDSKEISKVHQFIYSLKEDNPPLSIDKSYLRDNNIEISSNDSDISIYQLMGIFKSYCMAIGYEDESFRDACNYFCTSAE